MSHFLHLVTRLRAAHIAIAWQPVIMLTPHARFQIGRMPGRTDILRVVTPMGFEYDYRNIFARKLSDRCPSILMGER